MNEDVLKQALEVLKLSQQYRVIERYEKPDRYALDEHCPKLIGMFLDVETTGFFPSIDKIIELGFVLFEYSTDGRIFRILEEFSQYQDPGMAIPQEIIELTGISNEMVAGCRLDKKTIFQYLNQADLIIAHYAAFDRAFMEALWGDLPVKKWACSMMEVPWKQERIESGKLEYLAYKYGFFYDGHRASSDCLAGVHVLSKALPRSKALVLKVLLENSQKTTFRVWALDAPIAQKDTLKNRLYRWNPVGQGKHKAWSIELSRETVLAELEFLWEEVYGYSACIPVEVVDANTRFSKTAILPEYAIKNAAQFTALVNR